MKDSSSVWLVIALGLIIAGIVVAIIAKFDWPAILIGAGVVVLILADLLVNERGELDLARLQAFLKSHAKSLLAAAIAGVYAFQAALSPACDGCAPEVTSAETVGIVIAILTALTVYVAPNKKSPPAA